MSSTSAPPAPTPETVRMPVFGFIKVDPTTESVSLDAKGEAGFVIKCIKPVGDLTGLTAQFSTGIAVIPPSDCTFTIHTHPLAPKGLHLKYSGAYLSCTQIDELTVVVERDNLDVAWPTAETSLVMVVTTVRTSLKKFPELKIEDKTVVPVDPAAFDDSATTAPVESGVELLD